MRTFFVAALAGAALLSACSSAAERCASAKNPAECQQVVGAGGDVDDYLLYGMAGYMLSSAVNGAGQRQAVIVPDPGYRGYRRPVASYDASPALVRRSTTTVTTTKRSAFGGTKATTRTTSYSSRPVYRSSYSGSSYRPSYRSSFGRR